METPEGRHAKSATVLDAHAHAQVSTPMQTHTHAYITCACAHMQSWKQRLYSQGSNYTWCWDQAGDYRDYPTHSVLSCSLAQTPHPKGQGFPQSGSRSVRTPYSHCVVTRDHMLQGSWLPMECARSSLLLPGPGSQQCLSCWCQALRWFQE